MSLAFERTGPGRFWQVQHECKGARELRRGRAYALDQLRPASFFQAVPRSSSSSSGADACGEAAGSKPAPPTMHLCAWLHEVVRSRVTIGFQPFWALHGVTRGVRHLTISVTSTAPLQRSRWKGRDIRKDWSKWPAA